MIPSALPLPARVEIRLKTLRWALTSFDLSAIFTGSQYGFTTSQEIFDNYVRLQVKSDRTFVQVDVAGDNGDDFQNLALVRDVTNLSVAGLYPGVVQSRTETLAKSRSEVLLEGKPTTFELDLVSGELLKRKDHRVGAQGLRPLEGPHKTGNFWFKSSPQEWGFNNVG